MPDVVTLGKGLGNGFPVTAMVVREPYADAVDKISASTSYGGNPMACAAALASIEVVEEEGILEHVRDLEALFARRMANWSTKYTIVGDTRVKGCLMGVELVKDKATKEPFDEAGKLRLPARLPQGARLDPCRAHPADEPSARDARRRRRARDGHHRGVHRGGGETVGVLSFIPQTRHLATTALAEGSRLAASASLWQYHQVAEQGSFFRCSNRLWERQRRRQQRQSGRADLHSETTVH